MNTKIVSQTKVAFIGYMLLFVAQVVYIIQKPEAIKMFVPNLLGFAVVAILGLYVINCSVLGSCNMYAWIMGYLIAVLGVVVVIGVVYKMMM
jgi:hypothetical protein